MLIKYSKHLNIKTLKKIRNNFEVPKFFFVKKSKIKKIESLYKKSKVILGKNIIIRSSSVKEDKLNNSGAGKYYSAQLKNLNKENFYKELKFVLKKLENKNDYIIFQKLIINPDISGVLFTRDISTNAPYYVINYDTSGKTDLITSGAQNTSQKTLNIFHYSKEIPKKFLNLIKVIKYLVKIFNNSRLDIEFAIKKNKIYIFQLRVLPTFKGKIDDKLFISTLTNIEKKIKKFSEPNPFLSGAKTLFSNMADWNPAEMIGSKPHPLSYSLYSELITNETWARQRDFYGYKNVIPNRLMINFAGNPYIDLRTDFNSFLPKNLNLKLEKKLVEQFILSVKKKNYLHDKIEFNVIPTCYSFQKNKILEKKLNKKLYNKYYIKLKALTKNIINNKNSFFYKDLKNIKKFNSKIRTIENSNLSSIQKIFFLNRVTKDNGVLQFAGIARAAFISTSIIKDLNKLGLIDEKDIDLFYSNLNTITNKINFDFNQLIKKKITKQQFLNIYGHLRPSTYSISSMNYKEGFNFYFYNKDLRNKKNYKNKKISKYKISKINKLFKKHDMDFDCKKFIKFAKNSIESREMAKFNFTKGINAIFENLNKLAKEININRNDLEYLDMSNILNAFNNLNVEKLRSLFIKDIKSNKKKYNFNKCIKLPQVIKSSKDIYFHYEENDQGNFITDKSASAKTIFISSGIKEFKKIKNINNKIILIENADPGYEFIFLNNIKGLITKYGGANSHMSIRCLELNIPAVIGIGEKKFNFLKTKSHIEINCKLKKISSL